MRLCVFVAVCVWQRLKFEASEERTRELEAAKTRLQREVEMLRAREEEFQAERARLTRAKASATPE